MRHILSTFLRRFSKNQTSASQGDVSNTQPTEKAPSGADIATDRLLGKDLDTELGQEGALRTAVTLARTEH